MIDFIFFSLQFILAKGDSTYLSPLTDMRFTFGLSGLLPWQRQMSKRNRLMP